MKWVLGLLMFVLALSGCGKVNRDLTLGDEPTGNANRGVVDSGSSNADMRRESRDLSDLRDDVIRKGDKVKEICDDIEERIAAFNDEFKKRNDAVKKKEEERDGLKEAKKPYYYALLWFVIDKGRAQGEIDAIKSYTDKLDNRDKFLRALVDRRVSARTELRKAKRDQRQAERDLNKAEADSPEYIEADRRLTDAKGEIERLEKILERLHKVSKADLGVLAAEDKAALTGLEARVKEANKQIILSVLSLVSLEQQIRSIKQEIAALPTVDNLKSIELPPYCGKLF